MLPFEDVGSILVQEWFHFNRGGRPAGVQEIAEIMAELKRHGIADAEISAEIKRPERTRGEWPTAFRDRMLKLKYGGSDAKAKQSVEDLIAVARRGQLDRMSRMRAN